MLEPFSRHGLTRLLLAGARRMAFREVLIMKRLASLLILGVAALLVAPAVTAVPIMLHATLSGPAESPPNASPGIGFALVVIDAAAPILEVHVTFGDRIGTTTALHIHCCAAASGSGTAGVATMVPTFLDFPLGVTSGTYDHSFDLTLDSSFNPAFEAAHGGTAAGAETALEAGLFSGLAHLNVRTTFRPGSEIRGFLVPGPASLVLLGVGVAGLAVSRHRNSKLTTASLRAQGSLLPKYGLANRPPG
jgi:hypothetical protein